jgi:hypothetical protein
MSILYELDIGMPPKQWLNFTSISFEFMVLFLMEKVVAWEVKNLFLTYTIKEHSQNFFK